MNLAIIIGNLGKDPELRHTGSGTAVCSFSVATSEKWTGKDGEKKEQTEWHNVVVWEKQAETCAQYLKKGSKVCVRGSIQTRKYDKDGQTRYSTEIKAERVEFLSGVEKKETATKGDGFGDDIPF